MSIIVGIDLGTTFSATGLVREGVPHILDYNGEHIMPSIVSINPPKSVLVGTPARNQYALYPERTARSIKRKMGQEVKVTLGDQEYTPSEISAIILRELKRRAEAELGEPVERAVITVPAYFSDAARQATREAGEIAGFTVERIINEPTAAALAYGLDRSEEHQLVAVYDLGGGTFDVSIIELADGVVEVRASHGNTELGGDDFDQRLADLLAEGFIEQHGVDPRQDARANARLLRAAEEAKIGLSARPFVTVREEYLLTQGGKPLHLEREISRGEFEELIADLIEGTLQSLDAALRDARLKMDDLERILFVGGSTRIPLVWSMVNEHTGLEPEVAINPDEAVALGAAVQAAIIAGEPLDAILVDVTPHSLGIAVAEIEFGQIQSDRYSVLIPRNTTIPTSRSEVYSALHPSQSAIELKIYQGEQPIASRNTLLGEFLFDKLRPENPGQPPRITVQFDFDVNGILHVSAVDRGSGNQANSSIKANKTRLTPAEITSAHTGLVELDWEYSEEDEDEDEDNNIIDIDMVHISAIALARGGAGRTTLVRKLGTVIAEAGHRVLLIDFDPQAALSAYYDLAHPQLEQPTLYQVLIDPDFSLEQLIQPVTKNLDLAPTTLSLLQFEVECGGMLKSETWSGKPQASLLSKRLQRIADQYDYIFIDTPPLLGILTANALVAAQEIIIPRSRSRSYERVLKQRDEMALRTFVAQVQEAYSLELTITPGYYHRLRRLSSIRNSGEAGW